VQKIGILGGSFNPIHTGHLSIAQLALDFFSLSHIIFVPTKYHPHQKESLTVSAPQRAEMVEIAIESNPNFSVWYGELNRNKVSYTIDTISQLSTKYPNAQLYLIVGADNLESFTSWYKYEEILSQVTLAATDRPNSKIIVPKELNEFDVKIFPSPKWGISSTEIRNYIAGGLSGNYLLPEKVVSYIKKNNLYTGEKSV
jgi:nicotinate-nucleotide adenylyltransferase